MTSGVSVHAFCVLALKKKCQISSTVEKGDLFITSNSWDVIPADLLHLKLFVSRKQFAGQMND